MGASEKDWAGAERAIEHLNACAGRSYRARSAAGYTESAKLAAARIGEWGLDDVLAVIEAKSYEWSGTRWDKYLRPATLFGKTKFEQYRGQIEVHPVRYGDFLEKA